MIEEMKSESAEVLFKDAEVTLRKALARLGQWGEQAHEIIQNKPTAILAVAAVSGFISGTLLRHGLLARRAPSARLTGGSGLLQGISAEKLGVDPLLFVAGGLIAGVLIGPRVLEQAFAQLDKMNDGESRSEAAKIHEFERSPMYATGSMNERPFEKV